MRRAIKGKTPDEIKAMDKSEMNQPTSMEDIQAAVKKVSPSVSKVRWLSSGFWRGNVKGGGEREQQRQRQTHTHTHTFSLSSL